MKAGVHIMPSFSPECEHKDTCKIHALLTLTEANQPFVFLGKNTWYTLQKLGLHNPEKL